MAKSKKKKTFRAVTAVKALARERIGEPRPGQIVLDSKKKAKTTEKHKTTLGRLLEETENR
ncbi:MAG TPA: hypothetical protein VHV29_03055 [Terriglobales bacterium]|jgi:hypothetical protein|nr:hypothetical protein [Terriglobales bacterium]